MFNALGCALRRLLQHALHWPSATLPLKLLLHGVVLVLFKTTRLRRMGGPLLMRSGLQLAGGPMRSVLNWIVFYRGEFEPTLSACLRALIRPGDVCVDAGANTGYFALLLADRVGPTGQVIAIEPVPGNQVRMAQNLELNQLQERVRVVSAACSDRIGLFDFFINTRNDMHSRLQLPKRSESDHWLMGGRHAWRKITVQTAPLSHWVGQDPSRVRFIKLDIEGMEHLLARDIIDHFTHPDLMVALEAKSPHIARTLRPFEDAGFHVCDLRNDYHWLFSAKVQDIQPVRYAQLYRRRFMVDVLLSRKPLPGLTTLSTSPSAAAPGV